MTGRPSTPATQRGDRVAHALAAAMKAEGVVDPGEQFATMLGLSVAGFASMGADLEGLLEAVRQAYAQGRKR